MLKQNDIARVFQLSEERAFSGQPFQLTEHGIWLPTPLDVIDSALAELESRGFWKGLEPMPTVLDAGMGDGRVVASLCRVGRPLRACGIESNPLLFALAVENLSALPVSNWSVCRGSFLEPATYEELGVPLRRFDVIFHYPDGNEDALADFWLKYGRDSSFLVLLTPDQSIRLEAPHLVAEHSVDRGFRLYLYCNEGSG